MQQHAFEYRTLAISAGPANMEINGRGDINEVRVVGVAIYSKVCIIHRSDEAACPGEEVRQTAFLIAWGAEVKLLPELADSLLEQMGDLHIYAPPVETGWNEVHIVDELGRAQWPRD